MYHLNPDMSDDTVRNIFNALRKETGHEDLTASQYLLQFFADRRITDDREEPRPEGRVTIHGIPVCTPGSITQLSGPSKSGKTAITNVLCAGAIAGAGGYAGSAAINVAENKQGHAVLHIDTEQSLYHHCLNFKHGIKSRTALQKVPGHFVSYNLQGAPQEKYKTFTNALFEWAMAEYGGIHLAVIDGVADYISSVNDEVDANKIVRYFEQLATQYNTAIVLVVHQNPGSEKERGHLGSQLQRKCESTLSIHINNDSKETCLQAKYLRHGSVKDFSEIYFSFDKEKGYHTFMDADYKTKEQIDLESLAYRVFTQPMNANDAKVKIMSDEGVELRRAAEILSDMYAAGHLEKMQSGKYVIYSLRTNTSPDEEVPF